MITTEQIELREDVKAITGGFNDWFIVLESKIDHLERSPPLSRFRPEITETFASDLVTLWHNFNQSLKARNEIELEVTYASPG